MTDLTAKQLTAALGVQHYSDTESFPKILEGVSAIDSLSRASPTTIKVRLKQQSQTSADYTFEMSEVVDINKLDWIIDRLNKFVKNIN